MIDETQRLYLAALAHSERQEDDEAGAEAWDLVERLARPALAERAAKPELLDRARSILGAAQGDRA